VKDNDDLPTLSWRRRLLLLALGVVTALVVVTIMLAGPGGVRMRPPPDAARCVAGQTVGCVGGTVNVIVAPAASPASAAGPAARPAPTTPSAAASRPGSTR